jgi:hypothetical protein
VFLLGLQDHNTPRIRTQLVNMLQHGNFSNLYSYGSPSQQQLRQDDAEYEPQQQQQQQGKAEGVSYPADTHYVDITEAIQASDADIELSHQHFLLTREPLSGTLQINMPKKLVWDWQLPQAGSDNNSSSSSPAMGAATGVTGEVENAEGSEAQAAAATAAASIEESRQQRKEQHRLKRRERRRRHH